MTSLGVSVVASLGEAADFLYDQRQDSPGSGEEAGERRLAVGLTLGVKKRRKQSKPVRIHALDETEVAQLGPPAGIEELACARCPRVFSRRTELSQHELMEHPQSNGFELNDTERAIFCGDLPLNLSSQNRDEAANKCDTYRAGGRSPREDYPVTDRAGHQTEPGSCQSSRRPQSEGDSTAIRPEDYRIRVQLEPDEYGASRQPEQEDYRTTGLSEPEDYRTTSQSEPEDYRTSHRWNSSDFKSEQSDYMETLSSLQSKFSTPAFAPLGPPPHLLPFLSQQLGGSAPSETTTFNSDTSCELCGKEFCNKYFLRTHRAKKHGAFQTESGISPPPPPPPPPLPPPPSTTAPLTSAGRQSSSSSESHDSGRHSGEADAPIRPASHTFCQPCQKEFCDEHFLRRHRAAAHAAASSDERPPSWSGHHEMGEVTRPEPADAHDWHQLASPAVGPPTDRPTSDTSPDGHAPRRFGKEQLQRMGVTDADAFCNICCKEFCNKYFLKVHKYKMHSIGSPPLERDRERQSIPAASCPPLEKLLEAPLWDASFSKDCDQCQRPFQSGYLLQMHKYYFHGLGQQLAGGLLPPTEVQTAQKKPRTSRKKDNFGDDLKKLQGMIKGLHDKRAGGDALTCHLCQRKLESKATLQAHLVAEHGLFPGQQDLVIPRPPAPTAKQSGGEERSKAALSHTSGDTACGICSKQLYAPFFLQQHMQTAHGTQSAAVAGDAPPTPAMSGLDMSTTAGRPPTTNETAFLARIRHEVESQKKPERPRPASTSRSYCEICKKELCNKYFMKTHMIKMHGISLETHQSQGGAVCDVCQKELCSRYFLKVHQQNAHGLKNLDIDQDPRLLEETSKDEPNLEVCAICYGKFKTTKLLEQHMIGEHGAPKEKKSKSSSSSSSSSLSSAAAAAAAAVTAAAASAQLPSIGHSCTLCSQTFADLLSLRLHMLQTHPLPEARADDKATSSPTSDEAKLSSLWMREKLLRYPFGTFTAGFPPFLPAERMLSLLPRLGQVAAAASESSLASVFPLAPPPLLTTQAELEPTGNGSGQVPAASGRDADPPQPADTERRPDDGAEPRASGSAAPPAAGRWYRCVPCGLRFRRRPQYLLHRQQQHGRPPAARPAAAGIVNAYLKRRRRCARCGFAARARGTLLRHVRRHHQRPAAPAEAARRCLYALPLPAAEHAGYVMQSVVLSSADSGGRQPLVAPALAALPAFRPLSTTSELNVRLMPV